MLVEVESLAHGGDGIARLDDGRVAFVRGGCPGDRADIEVVTEHQRHVDARVVSIITPSPDRVEPPCPYFGTCGGCQWQHVSAQMQLAAKTRIISDALHHIGHVEGAVLPATGDFPRYGYRNKVELVAGDKAGHLALGFHALHSDTFVPIERCLLLPPKQQGAPRALAGAIRYLSGRHSSLGILRVGLRVSQRTGEIEVALWTPPGAFPRQMAAKALADAVGATSVVRVLIRGDAKARGIAGVEVLGGKGNWTEQFCGRRLTVSAPAFFQLNTAAAETLVTCAIGAAGLTAADRVLDLYSGAGTFTLPLAATGAEVVAVEASKHALADLRRNLSRSGLDADVVGGDARRELPALGSFDVIFVDPPRSGLHEETIGALAATAARSIVYVSCNPSTFARDAARLADRGYGLSRIETHDLFPQTYHVECVGLFTRKMG